MRRQIIAATVGIALGVVAVAAHAQQPARVRARSPENRTFTFTMQSDSGMMRMFDSRRGRIGITVALTPDRARDSIGARIEAVSEDAPAQRAGVRVGDLIVRWNGTRLADGSGDEDEFRSRPGQRLINLAQRLEPGDTVRLEIRRERRTQQFSMVADSADMDRIVAARLPMTMRDFRGPGDHLMPFNDARMRVFAFNGNSLNDLELVKVGPQLAEGLGVTEGLLVVDIDSGSTLGLRPGDVIVTIGGRRATTPAQAMRILSTYETEEAVQFDVMRQRQRQTVSGRLPANRGGAQWRVTPNMMEMPVEPFMHEEMLPMRRALPEEFREIERDMLPFRMIERPRMRMEIDRGVEPKILMPTRRASVQT